LHTNLGRKLYRPPSTIRCSVCKANTRPTVGHDPGSRQSDPHECYRSGKRGSVGEWASADDAALAATDPDAWATASSASGKRKIIASIRRSAVRDLQFAPPEHQMDDVSVADTATATGRSERRTCCCGYKDALNLTSCSQVVLDGQQRWCRRFYRPDNSSTTSPISGEHGLAAAVSIPPAHR